MNNIFTSKIGTNRGRSRVWIEGDRLAVNGWLAKETHYRKHWYAAAPTVPPALTLTKCQPDEKGAARVSGKGAHPVIDITSKAVTAHFAGYPSVRVHVTPTEIFITGSKETV